MRVALSILRPVKCQWFFVQPEVIWALCARGSILSFFLCEWHAPSHKMNKSYCIHNKLKVLYVEWAKSDGHLQTIKNYLSWVQYFYQLFKLWIEPLYFAHLAQFKRDAKFRLVKVCKHMFYINANLCIGYCALCSTDRLHKSACSCTLKDQKRT